MCAPIARSPSDRPGRPKPVTKPLVRGGALLDLDEVGVAWSAIAHTGSMGFRRLALAEGESPQWSVVQQPL
jgi:hypothetical protein